MRPPTIPTTIPVMRDDNKQTIIMKNMYNCLIEHREPKTNRILISLFMALPSRKEFPEYFNIIHKPIAMNKIRDRIEKQIYPDEAACLEDFKLMFRNCSLFNEDGSQIHQDALTLERLLMKRREQLLNEFNNQATRDANNLTQDDNHNSNNRNNSTFNNHLKSSNAHNDTTQNEDSNTSFKINHNHHNDTSIDSNSNLSTDVPSTPAEKSTIQKRHRGNSDLPKRQLLTGYIIYASEIRKQVIDKYPDQNFGVISRLVGNEWKALPHDIRAKYDQRALIHNKKVRERPEDVFSPELTNGLPPEKLTKRKLAKIAKEQMKQHHLFLTRPCESIRSPQLLSRELASKPASTPASTRVNQSTAQPTPSKPAQQQQQPQIHVSQLHPASMSKTVTSEIDTQTTPLRFVEPPNKRRQIYAESFKRYIDGLQVPNKDLLIRETAPNRPARLPSNWLGAGPGRHRTNEAALWALRDFMLQDAESMRRNLQPYMENQD